MKSLYRRPLLPSDQDAEVARSLADALIAHKRPEQPLTLRVGDDETIVLPERTVSLLLGILYAIASDQQMAIIPKGTELTTFQAADILNVSRPYLIKLLDEEHIPYRMVGSHRRIQLEDLLAYKERDDRKRATALDELVQSSQDMGMYPHP